MVMTDQEIRFRYERAENKKEMPQILADLNGTTKKIMQAKLQEMGLLEVKPRRVVGVDDEEALALYNEGKTDEELREALNISQSRLLQWRQAHNLLPNRRPKAAPEGRKMRLKDLAPMLATLAERYPEAELSVGGVPLMSLHLQVDMDAMGFVRCATVALETEEVRK